MKIKFREAKLSSKNLANIDAINVIIQEYQKDGYTLTLRQLYYQLVSRAIIPNEQKEYAKLSRLLKEGRMSGMVDWSAIEDRLRIPTSPASFDNPEAILKAAIAQYALPRQRGQETYVEVWVEKDALSGVLKRVTRKYHIPIMVNRGYSSVSAVHDSYNRFKDSDKGRIVILYLGDFDPSGLDMIRDIRERIQEFKDGDIAYNHASSTFFLEVIPIALTMKQIKQYNPPPNPAKVTDPRAKDYIAKHGNTSWEVDALKPDVLNSLLENAIKNEIDVDLYEKVMGEEWNDIKELKKLKKYL